MALSVVEVLEDHGGVDEDALARAFRAGVEAARAVPPRASVAEAVEALGNGSRVLAQDTVPFALWCAARHDADESLEDALWTTVEGLGDRDTTCAIVGGILAARPGRRIPEAWLAAREPLSVMGRGARRSG